MVFSPLNRFLLKECSEARDDVAGRFGYEPVTGSRNDHAAGISNFRGSWQGRTIIP
jgi:hypothetical protein